MLILVSHYAQALFDYMKHQTSIHKNSEREKHKISDDETLLDEVPFLRKSTQTKLGEIEWSATVLCLYLRKKERF